MRKSHRANLARHGSLSLRARPITAEQVCLHAEQFWFGSDKNVDKRDVLLHAVLVLGLNMGMRYDEIFKLTAGHLSVIGGNVALTLAVAIKNSTEQRNYVLREWPGDSALRHSLYMDPKTALLSWLTTRGCKPGPLFCDFTIVRSGTLLDLAKPLSPSKFSNLLRERLLAIGIGADDVKMYTGHSIKRGAVQLYRSLGVRDEMIMEIIQMKGVNAYLNYCEAYNDCSPSGIPRFASIEELLTYSKAVSEEQVEVQDESDFSKFLEVLSQKASGHVRPKLK